MTDAKAVADDIVRELGDWGVSELGDVLDDAIWDRHSPYQTWTVTERSLFRQQVYDEIYG